MASTEERMKILQMLQEGRLSAESAAQLLQAVEEGPVSTPPAPEKAVVPSQEGEGGTAARPRWLRVRVTDTDTGRPRVNVRLPISLVNVGLKLGSQFAPEIEGVDFEELIHAANSGETGAFVDVYDEDDGEHVEVFLE
ncbi:MAG: hypothetical protein IH586_22520 [Anaerolineaceae bacterium]|nr:hypothetical protein [Anaerolineaceae bacterium]